MTTRQVDVKTGYVEFEGDDLYYEIRGTGQPLLMITGGGGDGRVYTFVANILADEYKVITYDRRGNGRSSSREPQNFEVSQHSRDAVAVLQAAGETSAYVFGCSSGAVIALDMAKTQPDAIRAVVVHEPPTVRVLSDSERWQRFFAGLHYTAYRFGVKIAMFRFAFVLGLHLIFTMAKTARSRQKVAAKLDKSMPQMNSNDDFFLKHELLPVTNYFPDVQQIKRNGASVYMAIGKWTLDNKKVYGRTVPILADRLGCEMVVLPGHHVSYVDIPEEWAGALRAVLHRAEKTIHELDAPALVAE